MSMLHIPMCFLGLVEETEWLLSPCIIQIVCHYDNEYNQYEQIITTILSFLFQEVVKDYLGISSGFAEQP